MLQNTNPPSYPKGGSYADLLRWHLFVWGTRPGRSTTRKAESAWDERVFIDQVYKGENVENPKNSFASWIGGERSNAPGPKYGRAIARVLFDGQPQFAVWAADLEDARLLSQGEGSNPSTMSVEAALAEIERTRPKARLVPAPVQPLIGREREIAVLSDLLADVPGPTAILVQGHLGIGKSELAKAVAHHALVVTRFHDRRWFVQLEHAATIDTLELAILEALGLDSSDDFQAALNFLREGPSLLVFDQLEAPWESSAQRSANEALLTTLRRETEVSIIASSRAPISGLGWHRYHLGELSPAHAQDMLSAIAGQWVRDDPDLGYLIECLGGIPLAIGLMGRRASGRTSLAPLSREWRDRGVDILRLPDEMPGALTSLPESIRLSLASPRMTTDAYRLFALLGHLPSSVLEEHIEALTGVPALDIVEPLLRVGLVLERSGRIALSAAVKDYARRNCPLDEEGVAAIEQHYLKFISELGGGAGTSGDQNNVQRIMAEINNVECAFGHAFRTGKAEGLGDAMRGLTKFISISSYRSAMFTQIDDSGYLFGNVFNYAYYHIVVGEVNFISGNIDVAERGFRSASQFFKSSQNDGMVAESITKLAAVKLSIGELDDAKSLVDTAFELYDDDIDRVQQGECLRICGEINLLRKDHENARDDFAFSITYCSPVDPLGTAKAVYGYSHCYIERGDLESARGAIEECLETFQKMHCKIWQGHCHFTIGQISSRDGKYEVAKNSLMRALAIYREVEYAPGIRKSQNEMCRIGEFRKS